MLARNYKGDIYEYPEIASRDKTKPEPTPIYRHLEFLDPIEEREEITSRSWRAGPAGLVSWLMVRFVGLVKL